MNRRETIETTLGDLVVVLTEETARFIHDEEGAYEVVASILEDLLGKAPISNRWH